MFMSSGVAMSERTICCSSVLTEGMSRSNLTIGCPKLPEKFITQSTFTELSRKLPSAIRSLSETDGTVYTACRFKSPANGSPLNVTVPPLRKWKSLCMKSCNVIL